MNKDFKISKIPHLNLIVFINKISLPPMSYDYSTIEHDFLHMKDYFNNYKFTYKERRSKLDFLQNITNEPGHDTSSLIASSKEQLVEVKNVYKKTDAEIKELSKSIFEEQEKLQSNTLFLENLSREEEQLRNELARLTILNENILIYDRFTNELDELENEIKNTLLELENTVSSINPDNIESLSNEEKILREERNELASKQRRLTIINTDNFIEDIFYWKRNYLDFLENIFGEITVSVSGDRFTLKIVLKENILELTVKGKQLIEAYLSKNVSTEILEEFERVKEYSFKINDAKPLLSFFTIKC